MKQPTSVKVISWLNIIASLFGFGSVFYLLWESFNTLGYILPESILPLTIAFIVSALVFLSSIAMLEGKSWGRTLYIVVAGLSVIFTFIYDGYADKDAIKSLVRLCIFAFFLYRPIVNEYFKCSKVNEVQE